MDGTRLSVNWRSGNAEEDSRETRGWLLGHFIDPTEGVRSSKDVEVKWGIHPSGDKRARWTADDQRTTLVILVSGKFRIDLTEANITLDRKGDYVLWGPGIDHSWEALAESIVLTVRWPSSAS
jgi:quercetin dioxygenase-like cupin family protein